MFLMDKTNKIDQMETLILNIDYTGNCIGSCPGCVLSKSERKDNRPFLTPSQIEVAMEDIAPNYGKIGLMAIGLGRGNTLTLDEEIVTTDILKIAKTASRLFDFEEGCFEMSTSLLGKVDDQIRRAKNMVDFFEESQTGFDPRFVIVANPALKSPKYWDKIDEFLTSLNDYRGNKDGSSDILIFNLAADALPDLNWLEDFVSNYHFPVNIIWAPGYDKALSDANGIKNLSDWLIGFYDIAKRLDLDNNLINRIRSTAHFSDMDIPSITSHLEGSSKSLLFISRDGNWHEGLFSVLGDLDPVRFDPKPNKLATNDDNPHKKLVAIPKKEMSDLLRIKTCRSCPYLRQCVASGAYKGGLLALNNLPKNFSKSTDICPAAIRPLFERIYSNVA